MGGEGKTESVPDSIGVIKFGTVCRNEIFLSFWGEQGKIAEDANAKGSFVTGVKMKPLEKGRR